MLGLWPVHCLQTALRFESESYFSAEAIEYNLISGTCTLRQMLAYTTQV